MSVRLRSALLAAAAVCSMSPAVAAGVAVEDVRARPSLGAAGGSAVYLTLRNDANGPDALIRAEGDVADEISLHTHLMEKRDGGIVMRMRPVEEMAIPAHGETKLHPGGLHIMLIGVKKPLKPGDVFSLKLFFRHAAPVIVSVPVKTLAETMKGMHMKAPMKMKPD